MMDMSGESQDTGVFSSVLNDNDAIEKEGRTSFVDKMTLFNAAKERARWSSKES